MTSQVSALWPFGCSLKTTIQREKSILNASQLDYRSIGGRTQENHCSQVCPLREVKVPGRYRFSQCSSHYASNPLRRSANKANSEKCPKQQRKYIFVFYKPEYILIYTLKQGRQRQLK